MGKKQVNFRLDSEVIKSLDKLVDILGYELGVNMDRTKVIEKLVRDGLKRYTKI